MLSRRRRLRASEVKEVLARGRSVRGGVVSMKFLRTAEALRAAIVVSKSVARTAVLRNRVRRAAYEAIPALPHRGRALFFVRSIPLDPLRSVFREEITALLAKL